MTDPDEVLDDDPVAIVVAEIAAGRDVDDELLERAVAAQHAEDTPT